MIVIILPVSGSSFVSQLAAVQKLSELRMKPDIMLASSGGNVAAYVSVVADWTWNKVELFSREINSTLLFSNWSSISPISFMLGYFKGDVYNRGSGVKKLLEENVDQEVLKKYEIWTGTYNKDKQKGRLFCNFDKGKCKLDGKYIEYNLYQLMSTEYLDNDLDSISKVCIASATIPSLIPPQKIDGDNYVDGGVSSSSPLPFMTEAIEKAIEKNDEPLHLFQFSCCDLESQCNLVKDSQDDNILDNIIKLSCSFVRSQALIDRAKALDIIKKKGKVIHKEFKSIKKLDRAILINRIVKYSMIEIYPKEKVDVIMTNFSGEDTVKMMKKAYKKLKFRLWYVPIEGTEEKINNLFGES